MNVVVVATVNDMMSFISTFGVERSPKPLLARYDVEIKGGLISGAGVSLTLKEGESPECSVIRWLDEVSKR